MTDQLDVEPRTPTGAGIPASREVRWWPVHLFIEAAVAQANCGPLPVAGTPSWDALSDGDPRKLLALAVAGEHWILRTEIGQDAIAQANQDVWTGQFAPTVARHREIDSYRRTA